MPEEPEQPETAEAVELSEKLKEANEHGDSSLKSVSIVISVLAVLGPLLLILSHRAQTWASHNEGAAKDEWQQYQANDARSRAAAEEIDLLTLLSPYTNDKGSNKVVSERNTKIQKQIKEIKDENQKLIEDCHEEREHAMEFEDLAERAQSQFDRITFGQAVLQIGVLLSSITLYTRKRIFLISGLVLGILGLSIALYATFVP